MPEVIDPKVDSEERKSRLKNTISQLNAVLMEKYGASPDELEELRDEIVQVIDILANARMPFPFSQKETMAILKAPIVESWCHPITNLAHKLLAHHQVVNEPYMTGGIDVEDGVSKGVVCQCFYATVRVKPDEIRVYSNWDAGGMCSETIQHLVAIHETPEYMKALYPQLEKIANTQLNVPCQTYQVPLKVRLKLPAPECSGPGL